MPHSTETTSTPDAWQDRPSGHPRPDLSPFYSAVRVAIWSRTAGRPVTARSQRVNPSSPREAGRQPSGSFATKEASARSAAESAPGGNPLAGIPASTPSRARRISPRARASGPPGTPGSRASRPRPSHRPPGPRLRPQCSARQASGVAGQGRSAQGRQASLDPDDPAPAQHTGEPQEEAGDSRTAGPAGRPLLPLGPQPGLTARRSGGSSWPHPETRWSRLNQDDGAVHALLGGGEGTGRRAAR
jgi:hypothetical protein